MRMKALAISILFLLSLSPCFAQDKAIVELQKKVMELEKRVEILEKIIVKTNPGEIVDKKVPDKSFWRKLRVSMKEKEVIALLGEPFHIDRISRSNSMWTYYYEKNIGIIQFDDNGVSSWTEPYFIDTE